MDALRQIEDWGAEHASAGVLRGGEVLATHGARDVALRWASVTKLVTALAVLVAAEEGVVDLDEPAGPQGSTLRHLLAHASGLPFDGDVPIAKPGQRRIYSNSGFVELGEHLARAAEMPFAEYARDAVLGPLGIAAELSGSAAAGLQGTLDGLLALARECAAPSLVAAETFGEATTVQFPGLTGVLPGFGRWPTNDWGLGFELKDGKEPHWTGTQNSARTFGHFGGSGAFVWIDPDAALACALLTDREFDTWALEAWPKLSDDVLAEAA